MLTLAYTGDMMILLGVIAALMPVLSARGKVWRWCVASACLWIVACGLLALAHMLDMRLLLGVFEHGHTGLAWWYKIAGLWTYFDGSFLLWTAFVAAACLVRWVTSKVHTHGEAAGWGVLMLGHGLILLLSAQPFAVLTELPPEGLGFLPSLHVAHVVFHPPIMYAGLALLALSAMTALTQPYNEENVVLCKSYSRWAYGVMTLGLMWGGIWAYTELGWGGMWFWDPVETMALIPWIANLMLWHLLPRRGEVAWRLAPLPFMLVLFQVWGVRSGWLVSVHSFARDDEKGWLLLAGACFFALAAVWHMWRMRVAKIPRGASNYACIIFLSIIFVLIIGVAWPIVSEGSPDASWFNAMMLPFIAAGAWFSTPRRDKLWLSGVVLMAVAAYGCTPEPTWIGATAWGVGGWMVCGAWRLPSIQKGGHLSFGLVLMALAWKATWSYELAITAGQPNHGIHLIYEGTTQEATALSIRQIDHITLNGTPTMVITEKYHDGTTIRRMGTVVGLWSHWQVVPAMNPATPPTYWVGYRHGIHGVWIALAMLVFALGCRPHRRENPAGACHC